MNKRKFTSEQVTAIKRKKRTGATYKKLAEEYGVSVTTIHRIIQRQTYRIDTGRI